MNFTKKYDVVVAGGGIAGVAAALAASRRGMKTVLLEKTVFPGGLATSGLIYFYLPLCDGNGTQVSFGIAEELLLASCKYGCGDIPENWRRKNAERKTSRYQTIFSPASFVLALDQLLTDAGVDIWLDTAVFEAVVRNRVLSGVKVVNKSGVGLIEAKCFVDATGDADITHLSGGLCQHGDNATALWLLQNGGDELSKNIGVYIYGNASDKTMEMPGINGKLISEFIIKGRKAYREYLEQQYGSGTANRENLFPLTLPAMAQLRMTRRIDGKFTLQDGMEWTPFGDSVGLVADWRKSGYVWEVPYRVLLPDKIKGLLAAGRCISASGDAWDVMRVIPAAAVTGEAAGVAATLAVRESVFPDELTAGAVQDELGRKNRFPFHFSELGLVAKK
jgi:hypothetical protein